MISPSLSVFSGDLNGLFLSQRLLVVVVGFLSLALLLLFGQTMTEPTWKERKEQVKQRVLDCSASLQERLEVFLVQGLLCSTQKMFHSGQLSASF